MKKISIVIQWGMYISVILLAVSTAVEAVVIFLRGLGQ